MMPRALSVKVKKRLKFIKQAQLGRLLIHVGQVRGLAEGNHQETVCFFKWKRFQKQKFYFWNLFYN